MPENNKKIDYKKEFPDLYLPNKVPALVDVPAIPYIMVDGAGDPTGEDYQAALSILYALSFTIKMSKKGGQELPGYFEYVVPPLEGLWDAQEVFGTLKPRSGWRWTSMIRQPDFVTADIFSWAVEIAAKKKPDLCFERARFEAYTEGRCVQIMHIGPYADEPATLARVADFLKENNLTEDFESGRRHHEIYLGDPRKTKPENLKTVLRQPIKSA